MTELYRLLELIQKQIDYDDIRINELTRGRELLLMIRYEIQQSIDAAKLRGE